MANELTGDLISKWIGFKLYPDSMDEPFFSDMVMLQCVPSGYLCPGSEPVQEFLKNFFTQTGNEFINEITSSKMDIQDNMLIEDLKLNITSLNPTLPWLCPQHLSHIDLKGKKLTFETSMSVQFMDDLLVKIKLDWDAEEVEYQIKEYEVKLVEELPAEVLEVAEGVNEPINNVEVADIQENIPEVINENTMQITPESQNFEDVNDNLKEIEHFSEVAKESDPIEKLLVEEAPNSTNERSDAQTEETAESVVEQIEDIKQEAAEPATETVDPIVETAELVVEPLNSVVEPVEFVVETAELVVEPVESVVESVEPAVETVETENQKQTQPNVEADEFQVQEVIKSALKVDEVIEEEKHHQEEIQTKDDQEIPKQATDLPIEGPEDVNTDSKITAESIATDTDTENTLSNALDHLELVDENESKPEETAMVKETKTPKVLSSEISPKVLTGNGNVLSDEPEFIKVKNSLKPTPPLGSKSKPLSSPQVKKSATSKESVPVKPKPTTKQTIPVKTTGSPKSVTPTKVKSVSNALPKAVRTNSRTTDLKEKASPPIRTINRSSSTLISSRNTKPASSNGRSVPSTPRPASSLSRSNTTSSGRLGSSSTHVNPESSDRRYDPKRFSSQLDFTYPGVSTTPVRSKPEVPLRPTPERVIPTRKENAAKHHSTSFSVGFDNAPPANDPKPSEMPAWSKELRPYLSKGSTGIKF